MKKTALANIDTGLKVPGGLIMSAHYAHTIGRCQEISKAFVDPKMRSVSGHRVPVVGILRDVAFRFKGTSITFSRDFYVCDAIDNMVDVMIGAKFVKDHVKLLFEKVKECASMFAAWWPTNKESKKARAERERREREQQNKAHVQEIARLQLEQRRLAAQQLRTVSVVQQEQSEHAVYS